MRKLVRIHSLFYTKIGRFLLLAGVMLLSACAQLDRLRVPNAGLIDGYWDQRNERSPLTVDHSRWDAFLGQYLVVDGSGVARLHYARVSDDAKASLNTYIADLQNVDFGSLNRSEQLALWVNLYNARVTVLILDFYPLDSIQDISFSVFSIGPWDEPLLEIDGRKLSLNQLYHGIIRPLFDDERIHYIIWCGAIGCPNLGESAYRGSDIDARMTAAARAYINNYRGAELDDNGRLTVSSIYNWFAADFGGNSAGILNELRTFATGEKAELLARRTKIDHYALDWRLTDAMRLR